MSERDIDAIQCADYTLETRHAHKNARGAKEVIQLEFQERTISQE